MNEWMNEWMKERRRGKRKEKERDSAHTNNESISAHANKGARRCSRSNILTPYILTPYILTPYIITPYILTPPVKQTGEDVDAGDHHGGGLVGHQHPAHLPPCLSGRLMYIHV